MPMNTYKNNAWEEPDFAKRYDIPTSAWVDCESSKKYESGAWEENWTSMPIMTEGSDANKITNGLFDISNDKTKFVFSRFEDYEQRYGSLSGGGLIIFFMEGTFVNPTIEFDWMGGLTYWNNTYTYGYRRSAGYLYVYSRMGEHYAPEKQVVVSSVGSAVNATEGGMEMDYGEVSKTLTGIFDQIGIAFQPTDNTATYYSASQECHIYNVRINGEQVGFPLTSEGGEQLSDY